MRDLASVASPGFDSDHSLAAVLHCPAEVLPLRDGDEVQGKGAGGGGLQALSLTG